MLAMIYSLNILVRQEVIVWIYRTYEKEILLLLYHLFGVMVEIPNFMTPTFRVARGKYLGSRVARLGNK